MSETNYYFPYDEVRPEQDKLLKNIGISLSMGENLIAHAPTGLGKTIAALGPALYYAIKHDKTILFLTGRHTQHKIAIDTLREIKRKYDLNFNSTSIIGKKWMCLVPGINMMNSGDFSEYCKKVREDKKCDFFTKTKKNLEFTIDAKALLSTFDVINPLTTEKLIDYSAEKGMCPYEISIGVAKKSKVIVTDYYYMFHPKISASFLKKIGKEIEDIIIIVDEAHGLPERVKNLATENLSSVSVLRGIQEAKKLGFENVIEYLNGIQDVLLDLSKGMTVGEEKLIKKEDFTAELKIKFDYEQMSSDIHFVSDSMKEMQKKSYLGSIAKFLDLWTGQDDGFARILTLKKGFRGPFVSLSYRCLDPSVLTKKVIDDSYSSIFMSGTLLPTHMYKELLGVDNSREVVFSNPFPKNNKLNLVIPKTTTKYSKRSDEQYNNISKICEEITDAVPGNSVIFFPSYFILDQVKKYFTTRCQKTVFTEIPKMLKAEKQDLLERFKGYKEIGAVLLAVTSGSFSEGIDLPGDLLKCVVVVGLPLSPPNLEIKSLINYYDMKYGKGWDYGYLFPAFNKTLQSAGRCIRSETDRGVIVFLDERYAWKNYSRCFPEDWVMETTLDYKEKIDEFFNI